MSSEITLCKCFMKNKGGELLAVLSKVGRETSAFTSQEMGKGDFTKDFLSN